MAAIKSSTLYNKRGSSDKFYFTELIRTKGDKYFILAYYGRRPVTGGFRPHVTLKVKNHVPYDSEAAALNVFNDLVYRKVNYNFYTDTVPANTSVDTIKSCVEELRSAYLIKCGLEVGGKTKSKDEKIMEKVLFKGEEHRRLQIF